MQVVCFMNKKLMKKMYFWFIGAPITFWATRIPVSLSVAYLVQPYVKKKKKNHFTAQCCFLGFVVRLTVPTYIHLDVLYF